MKGLLATLVCGVLSLPLFGNEGSGFTHSGDVLVGMPAFVWVWPSTRDELMLGEIAQLSMRADQAVGFRYEWQQESANREYSLGGEGSWFQTKQRHRHQSRYPNESTLEFFYLEGILEGSRHFRWGKQSGLQLLLGLRYDQIRNGGGRCWPEGVGFHSRRFQARSWAVGPSLGLALKQGIFQGLYVKGALRLAYLNGRGNWHSGLASQPLLEHPQFLYCTIGDIRFGLGWKQAFADAKALSLELGSTGFAQIGGRRVGGDEGSSVLSSFKRAPHDVAFGALYGKVAFQY